MRFTYQVIFSIAFFLICIASLFSKKLREGLLGRLNLLNRLEGSIRNRSKQDPKQKVVWFHVASAGEFEQALPLMDELKAREPLAFIALTYFSPSGKKAVALETIRRKESSLPVCWNFADFLPLDFSFSLGRFFEVLKPQVLIILNKELWPQLIWTAHDKRIPCFLWMVHFTKKIPKWQRFLLPLFTDIGVINHQSLELLKKSDLKLSARYVGDTRLERVLFRKKHFSGSSRKMKLPVIAPQSVIAASFWEEDFKVLKDALGLLERQSIAFPIVIVPHEPHPHRITRWDKTLSLELKNRFSIQFIKQVGVLAELYSRASIVIVGGSFKKKIHNVLEPLAYQSVILSGPYFSNSSEAVDLFSKGVLQKVSDKTELAEALYQLTSQGELKKELNRKSIEYLNSYSSCSIQYLAALDNIQSKGNPFPIL